MDQPPETSVCKEIGDLPLPSGGHAAEDVLKPDDSVQTAGERMRKMHANAWPVEEHSKLVGIVTETDPDRDMSSHGHDPRAWRVGEVMTRDIVFCYQDDDCGAVKRLMDDHGIDHIPVVDRAMKVLGVLSRDDIAEQANEATDPKPRLAD